MSLKYFLLPALSTLLITLTIYASHVITPANAMHIEIMIASAWKSVWRRNKLRQHFKNCVANGLVDLSRHTITHHFYMGSVNQTQPELEEMENQNDMVLIGGPDMDPFVKRDITYILDRPTSRANRVAYGTRWIVNNMPTVDYVMYLDDDAFLSIPKLVRYLEHLEYKYGTGDGETYSDYDAQARFVEEMKMQNDVAVGIEASGDIAAAAEVNESDIASTDWRTKRFGKKKKKGADGEKKVVIDEKPDLSKKTPDQILAQMENAESANNGSLAVTKKVQHDYRAINGGRKTTTTRNLVMGHLMETLLDMSQYDICKLCKPDCNRCMKDEQLKQLCGQFPDLSLGGCMSFISNCQIFEEDEPGYYFGTENSPKWVLGMGWVFGKNIMNFISDNAKFLKKRGAADLALGYWLAPLEDIIWEDVGPTNGHRFHDFPMLGNMFAIGCREESILVHRMDKQRWDKWYDGKSCELNCPLEPEDGPWSLNNF